MRIPRNIRRIYWNAMTEIEAGEQLLHMQAAAYPQLTVESQARMMAMVKRLAGIEEQVEKIDVRSTAGAAALGRMGIKVKVKQRPEVARA